MVFEFKRAERMRYPFYRIAYAVCVIVRGINTPRIASLMMANMPNAIEHRVTHIDIGR